MKAQIRLADTAKKGMNRKFNFTKESLAAIKPPASGRIRVYDSREPGLEYMVTSNGVRSFNLYRWFKAKERPIRGKLDVETIDQARAMAREYKGLMAKGIDPFEDRRAIRQSSTLGELWEWYKEKHLQARCSATTLYSETSRWKTCLEDWAGRKAITIKPEDIRAKHTELSKKRDRPDGKKGRQAGGPITANRAIQLLRSIFNFCRIEPNPADAKHWDAHPENQRERFLHGNELKRLFAELDKIENTTIADFLRMSLFTGARKSNVLAMAWAHINQSAGIWTIPAHQSKNGRVMTVYLSQPAMEILRRREGIDEDFVFPGKFPGTHLQEPKTTWYEVRKAAGIPDCHMHDLRRTLGSWAAAAGASLPIIGRQLGHQDSSTTAIYARLNLEPVKVAIDSATAAMLAAAAPPPEKKGGKKKETTKHK